MYVRTGPRQLLWIPVVAYAVAAAALAVAVWGFSRGSHVGGGAFAVGGALVIWAALRMTIRAIATESTIRVGGVLGPAYDVPRPRTQVCYGRFGRGPFNVWVCNAEAGYLLSMGEAGTERGARARVRRVAEVLGLPIADDELSPEEFFRVRRAHAPAPALQRMREALQRTPDMTAEQLARVAQREDQRRSGALNPSPIDRTLLETLPLTVRRLRKQRFLPAEHPFRMEREPIVARIASRYAYSLRFITKFLLVVLVGCVVVLPIAWPASVTIGGMCLLFLIRARVDLRALERSAVAIDVECLAYADGRARVAWNEIVELRVRRFRKRLEVLDADGRVRVKLEAQLLHFSDVVELVQERCRAAGAGEPRLRGSLHHLEVG